MELYRPLVIFLIPRFGRPGDNRHAEKCERGPPLYRRSGAGEADRRTKGIFNANPRELVVFGTASTLLRRLRTNNGQLAADVRKTAEKGKRDPTDQGTGPGYGLSDYSQHPAPPL